MYHNKSQHNCNTHHTKQNETPHHVTQKSSHNTQHTTQIPHYVTQQITTQHNTNHTTQNETPHRVKQNSSHDTQHTTQIPHYVTQQITTQHNTHHTTPFNPIRLEDGGSARADFNFRELPLYLSNTYQMWPLLLKFIGEQDSVKQSRQRYHMLPRQLHFWRHVYSKFDFLNIFLH